MYLTPSPYVPYSIMSSMLPYSLVPFTDSYGTSCSRCLNIFPSARLLIHFAQAHTFGITEIIAEGFPMFNEEVLHALHQVEPIDIRIPPCPSWLFKMSCVVIQHLQMDHIHLRLQQVLKPASMDQILWERLLKIRRTTRNDVTHPSSFSCVVLTYALCAAVLLSPFTIVSCVIVPCCLIMVTQ